jgi:large subunit ribosomal protein L17
MRHGKKVNHLGRTASHRKAMLSNMACSLIEHKRINTTVAKAKALKKYLEPLLTKSKSDSTHSRRTVFSYLKNKFAVTELFREIAPKIADRPGGYTRIIRTGYRLGDNADMCMIELVDFNLIYGNEEKKSRTRRSRRGGAKAKTGSPIEVAAVATAVVEDVDSEGSESSKEDNENVVPANELKAKGNGDVEHSSEDIEDDPSSEQEEQKG